MAVDPNQSFPALEEQVLARWRERDVFAESIRAREGGPEFVFYEGPPTANGKPGAHHVLARVFKDIFPRYKTMRGFHVARKGGWDTHGLPVEIQVEKQLGLTSKKEIEAYGIEAFNAACRESVFTYLEDWNALTERIGFWLDLDDAYRTLDPGYVESVWWALKQIWNKGLIYEGHKVVPYCPRCGTALASHEVAQGYKDVEDTSVYVRMPVRTAHGPLAEGDELLIWTTLPWTVLPNAAIAVNPKLTYVRASAPGEPAPVVLAEGLVERVLGLEGVEILDALPGLRDRGRRATPPSSRTSRPRTTAPAATRCSAPSSSPPRTAPASSAPRSPSARTTTSSASGPGSRSSTRCTRTAPSTRGWGPSRAWTSVPPTRPWSRRCGSTAGSSGPTPYEHSFPHCWRCSTPLIYYAKPSWYIETSRVREQLEASNQAIEWHPPHIKDGRMGDWLADNVDWALRRERYWGTPLPVWRCEEGHTHCVGSLDELEELSGVRLDDPHRPYVDDVSFPCPQCARRMQRVPEVIDVWFDSGAMPFAQHHAPFENEEAFERGFPADFVCEALDQTRGWFYSLIAVGTLLFDRAPMEHVVCLGLILDEAGFKMSKSKGNIVEPGAVIDRFGADAFRWYFFTSKQPWDGYRFSMEAVGDGVRLFLKQLWNTYAFLETYTVEADAARRADRARPLDPLAPERDRRRSSASGSTTTTRPSPGGRSRPSSTTSPTGTSAATGAASGRGTRPPSRRSASACSPSRSCSRRSPRSSRTRSGRGSAGAATRCTSPTGRRRGRATRSSRSRWRSRATPCAWGSRRAAPRRSSCASRCARPSWSPRGASAPPSRRTRRSSARS